MKKLPILFFLFIGITITSTSPVEAARRNKQTTATTTPITREATEAKVREFFKDTPVMIEIARCESNFRQFTDAGNVLRGGSAGGMVGIFQFFESIHTTPAKALGFDLTTVEGNLNYAKHLYEEQGTTPWEPARSCWDTKQNLTRAELEAKISTLQKRIRTLVRQLERQRRQRS